MERDPFRLAYVGGVFEAGELVLGALESEIHRVAPAAIISPPLEPPVLGAARLAGAPLPSPPGPRRGEEI